MLGVRVSNIEKVVVLVPVDGNETAGHEATGSEPVLRRRDVRAMAPKNEEAVRDSVRNFFIGFVVVGAILYFTSWHGEPDNRVYFALGAFTMLYLLVMSLGSKRRSTKLVIKALLGGAIFCLFLVFWVQNPLKHMGLGITSYEWYGVVTGASKLHAGWSEWIDSLSLMIRLVVGALFGLLVGTLVVRRADNVSIKNRLSTVAGAMAIGAFGLLVPFLLVDVFLVLVAPVALYVIFLMLIAYGRASLWLAFLSGLLMFGYIGWGFDIASQYI